MSNTTKPFYFSKICFGVLLLGCISLAIPLIGYAINGSFMRFSGDDYCYGAVLTQSGFWRGQWISYFHAQTYNGNRYSLTLFSDLTSLFGPYMNSALPALAIITWIYGIVYLLHWAEKSSGISLRRLEKVFIAEMLVFFTLYMAPSIQQSLYWRSGMLPYLAPLITNTFLIGLILKLIQNRKTNYLDLVGIAIISLLAGGFSETAAFLQAGYLMIMLLVCLIAQQRKYDWASQATKLIGIALLSTLLALVVLAVSPSLANGRLMSASHDLFSIIRISLTSAINFILESIKGQPIPNAILFIFSSLISLVIISRMDRPVDINKSTWPPIILLIPLACYVLILFCVVPFAYVESAYPELRALITARLIMNLTIVATGALMGYAVYQLLNPSFKKYSFIHLSVLAIIGVFCIYPVYAARNIYRDIPRYQRWAAFWDQRDQEIRLAAHNNQVDVEVVKIDHIIPDVGELSEDPTYWYNGCAARYYGVGTIRANKSGWESP